MTLAPFYRLYELPWSPTEEIDARFRKIMWIVFAIFAVCAIAIPLLPVPDKALGEGAGDSRSHRQARDRKEGAASATAAAEDGREEARAVEGRA